MNPLFKKGVMTPDEPRELSGSERHEILNRRLNKKYSKGQLFFLWRVQEAWDIYYDYDDFSPLYKILEPLVRSKAESLERRWQNKRLSRHDFESVLWEVAWSVAEKHREEDNLYLYYETLKIAWKRRVTDITRKLKTKQGDLEASVDSLPEDNKSPDTKTDIEKEITDKLVLEQIFSDPSLDCKERELLFILRNNPDATLRELCEPLGFSHPEQVKRLLNRVREKLKQYSQF